MIPTTDTDLLKLETSEQPGYTYALDIENNRIRGMVDNLEAVKQAVYLILSTERYRYLIYSWNYGVELEKLIGQDPAYAYSEIKRCIQEALLEDDRINSVDSFSFEVVGRKVHVTFTVTSIYGTTETEVYI